MSSGLSGDAFLFLGTEEGEVRVFDVERARMSVYRVRKDVVCEEDDEVEVTGRRRPWGIWCRTSTCP